MKIALIVRRLNIKGGTQRQALALAQELVKRGHGVTVYTFTLDRERCYSDLLSGLRVVALDQIKDSGQRPRFSASAASGFIQENNMAKRLALCIDRDTEILHPHDTVAYRVAYYFKKHIRAIPSVWMMNDLPTLAWAFRRARETDPRFRVSFYRRIFAAILNLYERLTFIRAQNVIVVLSDFTVKLARKYLHRTSIVVRSGLDPEEFPEKIRTSLEGKSIRLLVNGVLFPYRRSEDAIYALKYLRDWGFTASLTIIGSTHADRAYAASLEHLAGELGMHPWVVFRGEVTEAELVQSYKDHDVFIFPNELQSWGLAVFEAMASGLPVVVSRGAGAHEVLTDLVNCILVNPRDPLHIAQAIRELILKSDFYVGLSHAGRAFVAKEMSWTRYADRITEVLEMSLQKK